MTGISPGARLTQGFGDLNLAANSNAYRRALIPGLDCQSPLATNVVWMVFLTFEALASYFQGQHEEV